MSPRGRIFVSYRRDDVPGNARGIRDRLAVKFGKPNLFMDVDSLLAGQRFDRELDKALTQCDVLVAVIGPRWMELLAKKARSGERDYVREEIAAALKRDIVVIPTLVGREGHMPQLPQQKDLPDEIRGLILHQRHNVVHESFGRSLDELIVAIETARRGGREPRGWKTLAATAGAAVLALGAWLAYLPNRPIWSWFDFGSRDQVATMDKDAARRAESEATKRADEDAKKAARDAAAECDRLAASPTDAMRPNDVPGVVFARIDGAAAWAACDKAKRLNSNVPRLIFQAARAAHVKKDFATARGLYQDAASKRSGAAMNNLGTMAEDGEVAPKDYHEAKKWYEQAAELGDHDAMLNLGNLHAKGLGVPRPDLKTARGWYSKAAKAGNAEAKDRLTKLK